MVALSLGPRRRGLWRGDQGDRIAWMAEQIAQFTGDDVEVIDLGDQALLPGFVDAQASACRSGNHLTNVASPPVGPVETIEDLQNTLRAYAAERDIPKENGSSA